MQKLMDEGVHACAQRSLLMMIAKDDATVAHITARHVQGTAI